MVNVWEIAGIAKIGSLPKLIALPSIPAILGNLGNSGNRSAINPERSCLYRRFSARVRRIPRTSVTVNPATAARAATGAATLYARLKSTCLWVTAETISSVKQRNATERKKQIAPVAMAIAMERKKVRMGTGESDYVRIIP